ncbi:hypothetical protein DFH28DRAFT_956305 [Melampsora americana]|nr:hypothetical protein DFH28DRAFT_956305 [Melampsora americana]
MKSLLHFFWFASLLCERISAQGMVPLLRNQPRIAGSSAVSVEPGVTMVNRFTFTAPEDIPLTMNEMEIRPSEEAGTNSRVHHRELDLNRPAKRIKIEITEESQDLDQRNKEEQISTDLYKSTPSQGVVPYSFFFQSAKKISAMADLDPYIIELAKRVQAFVSKIGASSRDWGWWIHQNESLVLECFITAHDALHKGILGEYERIWTLGIVAALVKHLPLIPTDLVKALQTEPWKHHVYLEIQAAIEFEESLTHKLRSLLSNTPLEITNQGLEECFFRARLFKSHDEIRQRYFPAKESGIDEFIANNLLNVKIPEDDTRTKEMIRSFVGYFKHLEIPSWEETYAKAIFIYLMDHWNETDGGRMKSLLEWISADFDLYRDLHFPFFKADIKSILRNPEFASRGIKYNELIDTSKPLRATIFEDFLTSKGLTDFSADLQSDMYKLTVIVSLIHPSLKELVVQGIRKNFAIVKRLAPVWLQMYPYLEIGLSRLFDYQLAPFKKRPNYFAVAHMVLLGEKMSKFKATQQLGELIVTIPINHSKIPPELTNKILAEVEVILQTHTENTVIPKVYVLVFQVIHHLVKYYEGATKILFRKLNQNIKFRKNISLSIDNVRKPTIFVDKIAQIDECVLIYEVEPFLLSLKHMVDSPTYWKWGQVNVPEETIELWAKELEFKTCPFPFVLIDSLPDPEAESLQWLEK